MKPWYDRLLQKLRRSYSNLIVVTDPDGLAFKTEFIAILKDQFFVHVYESEMRLRAILKKCQLTKQDNRVIVIRAKAVEYLPFFIQSTADEVAWGLDDVFPKLDQSTLRDLLITTDIQSLFELYQPNESVLRHLGQNETKKFLYENLRSPAIETVRESDDDQDANHTRWLEKINNLTQNFPKSVSEWQAWMLAWGDVQYRGSLHDWTIENLESIDNELMVAFEYFMLNHYPSLFYHGYMEHPVTADKIMPYLAMQGNQKTALVCLDGMGTQEWPAVKEYLQYEGKISFLEETVFSLIPTITAIARRGLFCGESRLNMIQAEPVGFRHYVQKHWKDGERFKANVFLNITGQWSEQYAGFDALGLVCNVVDNTVHSSIYVQNTKREMLRNLRENLSVTQLSSLFTELLNRGYRVFLTSDHGSVWCIGNGINQPKYLADQRSKRALLFPNLPLASVYRGNDQIILYDNEWLLGDSVAVFPRGRKMFGPIGDTVITHGGIHPEEVIVPFVEVML